jgi:hypothetical protein
MSLHAEYGAYFSYFKNERHSKYVYLNLSDLPVSFNNHSENETGFELIDRGVLFGLSVYF